MILLGRALGATAARRGAAAARRPAVRCVGGGAHGDGGSRPAPLAFSDLGATAFDKEGAVSLYDRWAETYDETLRSWDYPAPRRTAELLRTFADAATPDTGRPVPRGLAALRDGSLPLLDAGCGTGLSGDALRVAGFTNLVGTDVSQQSLDVCRRKGVFAALHLADLEGAAGPLPFADDSLAGVACVGVLSYVHRFDRAFSEWCRIVAPGGLVAFTHRDIWWDGNVDGVQDAARACPWEQCYMSEPEDYLPRNPEAAERAKRIRYFVYRVS